MDGRSFDTLTRKLGAVGSRRAALKALLGGAVTVAAGAAVTIDDADAIGHSRTCSPGQARCAHHADCCSGTCVTEVVRHGRQRIRVGRCAMPVACGPEGDGCNGDSDCCDGLICYVGGIDAGECWSPNRYGNSTLCAASRECLDQACEGGVCVM